MTVKVYCEIHAASITCEKFVIFVQEKSTGTAYTTVVYSMQTQMKIMPEANENMDVVCLSSKLIDV